MRRARTRNIYSTFVVSDLEACNPNTFQIMKFHIVSGVPQALTLYECLIRFPHFCMYVRPSNPKAVVHNRKRRKARFRNTYATFVPSEIPRNRKYIKHLIRVQCFAGHGTGSGSTWPAEPGRSVIRIRTIQAHTTGPSTRLWAQGPGGFHVTQRNVL